MEAIIYAITSEHTDRVYIGSTKKNLRIRLAQHKAKFVAHATGGPWISSIDILRHGDYKITALETFEAPNKQAIYDRENYHIAAHGDKCVNRNRAPLGLTVKEYNQAYYDAHAAQILERKNKKITCDCGRTISLNNIARHLKSSNHTN